MMEESSMSGYEAAKFMKLLIQEIKTRKEENFTSIEFDQDIVEINLPFTDTILTKRNKIVSMVNHFRGKL